MRRSAHQTQQPLVDDELYAVAAAGSRYKLLTNDKAEAERAAARLGRSRRVVVTTYVIKER